MINFNIQINPKDFHNTEEVLKFIQDIKTAFPDVTSVKSSVNSVSTSTEHGPLTLAWFKEANTSRIRRTEGRTTEQQAEHNLRTYKGYSDADIGAIIGDVVVSESEEDDDDIDEKDVF
jgi:sulfatase maturation enzyme AslB (radical SAM superfamily)